MGSDSRRQALGSGCCLCLGFVVALFATASPLWLWRSGALPAASLESLGGASFATGGFVIAESSGNFRCAETDCVVMARRYTLDEFNSTLCREPYFGRLGRYGFCRGGENGTLRAPVEMQAMQGLSSMSTLLLFVAAVLVSCSPTAGSCGMALFATFTAGVAGLCSLVVFLLALTCDWYNSLLAGGSLPFVVAASDCEGQPCLHLEDVRLAMGPAYWAHAFVFALAAMASLSSFGVTRQLRLDEPIEGAYGSGAPYGKMGTGGGGDGDDDNYWRSVEHGRRAA